MKKTKILSLLFAFIVLATLCFAQKSKRIATIAELKGAVEVKAAQGGWMPAKPGMILRQGDAIRTQKDSRAVLNLDGQAQTAIVEVNADSQLSLAELLEDKTVLTQTTLLDLSLGKILIKAKKLDSQQSKFEVKTPTSVVGVRGTTFAVTVEAAE